MSWSSSCGRATLAVSGQVYLSVVVSIRVSGLLVAGLPLGKLGLELLILLEDEQLGLLGWSNQMFDVLSDFGHLECNPFSCKGFQCLLP